MTEDLSRRDILTSSVAAAVSAALPSVAACEFRNGPTHSVVSRRNRRRYPREEDNGNRPHKSRDRTRRAIEGPQRLHFPEQGRSAGNGGRDRRGTKRTFAGPLAGLPIVIKDNINTATMPTSGGTPALQNVQPSHNAPSLDKLFKAGAIIIGKTNMHELAFGITSTNLSSFAGPVKNPYDKTRIPGGSSGGTAAAIAAGIVTCGLGTRYRRLNPHSCGADRYRWFEALGRQWRRAAALQRCRHGGPDQPHPRHRRPDGPHGRRRGAAGFRHHRHADGHGGAAARQTLRHSRGVLGGTRPRR